MALGWMQMMMTIINFTRRRFLDLATGTFKYKMIKGRNPETRFLGSVALPAAPPSWKNPCGHGKGVWRLRNGKGLRGRRSTGITRLLVMTRFSIDWAKIGI